MSSNNVWSTSDIEDPRYDFTQYGGGAGHMGEPSDEQIEQYQKQMDALEERLGLKDIPSQEELQANPKLVEKFNDALRQAKSVEVQNEIAQYVCEMTGNQPSWEELKKVPFRKRVPFVKKVQRTFLDPE
jgi:hypothetical protein